MLFGGVYISIVLSFAKTKRSHTENNDEGTQPEDNELHQSTRAKLCQRRNYRLESLLIDTDSSHLKKGKPHQSRVLPMRR
mmetsp:Transcript_7396/g.15075  ORF Transcript_7396/g.15075 Transcript_7396/m.15075 type:complete len:80 (+) Transcript_7396:1188-1427(+)